MPWAGPCRATEMSGRVGEAATMGIKVDRARTAPLPLLLQRAETWCPARAAQCSDSASRLRGAVCCLHSAASCFLETRNSFLQTVGPTQPLAVLILTLSHSLFSIPRSTPLHCISCDDRVSISPVFQADRQGGVNDLLTCITRVTTDFWASES